MTNGMRIIGEVDPCRICVTRKFTTLKKRLKKPKQLSMNAWLDTCPGDMVERMRTVMDTPRGWAGLV